MFCCCTKSAKSDVSENTDMDASRHPSYHPKRSTQEIIDELSKELMPIQDYSPDQNQK